MEFDNFGHLCQYVNSNTTEHLIDTIFSSCLLDVNYAGPMDVSLTTKQTILKNDYGYEYCNGIVANVNEIKQNIAQYLRLYNEIFIDETSKTVLFNLIAYRLTMMKCYIYLAYCGDSHQYFDSRIVRYREDCIFVDCGGLDGKNSVEFALNCPSYKHIYLYEPMDEYFDECAENVMNLGLENITLRKCAVYNVNTTLLFNSSVKGNSKIDGKGGIQVNAVTLDSDINEPIGFIKMDIEGSEKQAILGAANHIRSDCPIITVCVYHLPDDIWQITNLIMSINPEYSFILRHHRVDPNETVLYAIPKWDKAESDRKDDIINQCRVFVEEKSKYESDKLSSEMLFLFEQLSAHKNALRNSEKVVHELQDWTRQLEEAKEYLACQYENYKSESERKDKIIDKLSK